MQKIAFSDTAKSYKTPDYATNPKTYSGTAVFPGQDNDILLKLMQLAPYITYDNVISALRARSRLNNELSKSELHDSLVEVYKQMNNVNYEGNNEFNDDTYSLEDMKLLSYALDRLQRTTNKSTDEQIHTLQRKLDQVQQEYDHIDKELKKFDNLKYDSKKDNDFLFKKARERWNLQADLATLDEEIKQLQKKIKHLQKRGAFVDKYHSMMTTDSQNRPINIITMIKKLEEKSQEIKAQLNNSDLTEEEHMQLVENLAHINDQLETYRKRKVKKDKQNIDKLIDDLLEGELYTSYSPYRAACEILQKQCGKATTQSTKIDTKTIQSPQYSYNNSPKFQKALSILSTSQPSIYREIIDDIYAEYSHYPNFGTNIDPMKSQNCKAVIYEFVGDGNGQYSYNEETNQYEPDENGNYRRVTKTLNGLVLKDLQTTTNIKKDRKGHVDSEHSYIINQSVTTLAKTFVRNKYRNKQGYIDPILIAFIKTNLPKYNEEGYKDVSLKSIVNTFMYNVQKFAKLLQIIDDADPKKDIISPTWEKDLLDIKSKINENRERPKDIIIIARFIKDNLAPSYFTSQYLKDIDTKENANTDKDKQDQSRVIENASVKLNELSVLKKYDHKIYKNKAFKIDPIMIAWVEFYHIFNSQRNRYKKVLQEDVNLMKEIVTTVHRQEKNVEQNIKNAIRNIPSINTLSDDEVTKLINEELNRDIEFISSHEKAHLYKQAQIQKIRREYQSSFKMIYDEANKKTQGIYAERASERTLMNQLLHSFREQVLYFGEMLNKAIEQDTTGIAKKLISPEPVWSNVLAQILMQLDEYVNNKIYKNFNPAYLVDVLENNINKYGGSKKEYNPVDKNNFKNMSELNITYYMIKNVDDTINDILDQSI